MTRFKAVILDMDGVIVDSMPFYHKCLEKIISRYNVHISLEEYERRFAGIPVEKTLAELLPDHVSESEILADEKRKLVYAGWSTEVKTFPGLHELLQLKLLFAVASGSPEELIERTMLLFNIQNIVTVSAREVQNPKPASDVWLEAAKRLGVNPSECIIIEDGLAGIHGAKQAGMTTIGIKTPEDTSTDYVAQDLFEARQIIEQLCKDI